MYDLVRRECIMLGVRYVRRMQMQRLRERDFTHQRPETPGVLYIFSDINLSDSG